MIFLKSHKKCCRLDHKQEVIEKENKIQQQGRHVLNTHQGEKQSKGQVNPIRP